MYVMYADQSLLYSQSDVRVCGGRVNMTCIRCPAPHIVIRIRESDCFPPNIS
jgi:hypothetical protein